MNLIAYFIYALWAVVALVLKSFGLVGWWVALSWLWLPAAFAIVVVSYSALLIDVSKILKRREYNRTPEDCEHCLYGLAAKYDKEGKCLGEVMDATVERGKKCPYFKKNVN